MVTRVTENKGVWDHHVITVGDDGVVTCSVPAEAKASAWDELQTMTFAIQHSPNCANPWLVRLPGKGPIDLLPYGDGLGFRAHQTGDILGFGKTLEEAASVALTINKEKYR